MDLETQTEVYRGRVKSAKEFWKEQEVKYAAESNRYAERVKQLKEKERKTEKELRSTSPHRESHSKREKKDKRTKRRTKEIREESRIKESKEENRTKESKEETKQKKLQEAPSTAERSDQVEEEVVLRSPKASRHAKRGDGHSRNSKEYSSRTKEILLGSSRDSTASKENSTSSLSSTASSTSDSSSSVPHPHIHHPQLQPKRSYTAIWNNFFNSLMRFYKQPAASGETSPHVKKESKPKKLVKYGSFIQVLSHNTDSKKQKRVEVQVTVLIGKPLTWTTSSVHDEIAWFHQKMLKMRVKLYEELKADIKPSERRKFSMVNSLSHSTLRPRRSTAKFPVKVNIGNGRSEVVYCTGDELPMSIIIMAVPRNELREDYILKITDKEEVIEGPLPIIRFDYVINALQNGTPIEFDVVIKDEIGIEMGTMEEELIDENMLKELEDEQPVDCTPIRVIKQPLVVKLAKVEFSRNIPESLRSLPYCIITAGLYHGEDLLSPIRKSKVGQKLPDGTYLFNEPLSFDIPICNLPRAARMSFIVYGNKVKDTNVAKATPIAWINTQLFNHRNILKTGPITLNLWTDDPPNPFVSSQTVNMDVVLFVDFGEFTAPIEFTGMKDFFTQKFVPHKTAPSTVQYAPEQLKQMDDIMRKVALDHLTDEDKKMLWECRSYFQHKPQALPKFFLSINWADKTQVEETYKLMSAWSPLQAVDALELLSSKFADLTVREFAVQLLDQLHPDELQHYLPQLVQVLKNESYHYSPLACFLVRRALTNMRNGHSIFWLLRSELREPYIERYQLILEALLLGCGNHFRKQLMKQEEVVGMFTSIAREVQNAKSENRLSIFKRELSRTQFSDSMITLPIDPTLKLCCLVESKCLYFESKTLPILLTFKNAKGEEYQVIYKLGDDLRQDMLITQMIKLMDDLWKKEGLELNMMHYKVSATGPKSGLIEVVPNSETVFNIQMKQGGATAAFKKKYLLNWMESQHPDKEELQRVVNNFTRSLAGSCVATYVLGIGDRHNENIMLTKDGRLFHIDFGRVLGHWEKFAGVSRDRVPFVFTKEFAYVIDPKGSKGSWEKSEAIKGFIDLACSAYLIVRKHAHIFINLFNLMLSTGITELQSSKDIEYLKDSLCLSMTEQEARAFFTELVWKSLYSQAAKINFFVHNVAQKMRK